MSSALERLQSHASSMEDAHRLGASPSPLRRKLVLLLGYVPDWAATVFLVVFTSWLTRKGGFKRSFSLADTSLQHYFAVQERVSPGMNIVYAGVIPLVLMLGVGLLRQRSFWDAHNSALGLILSLGLTTTITNLIKVTVGRPRPDIIDRCQPIAGAVDPSPYGLSNLSICTVKIGHIIDDGFKSFPSGHSSFAFAGLGFLSLYIAGKLHLFDRSGHAIKAWVSLVPLMGAALIAISRTMDYRHHPTDVLVGGLLGLSMAVLTYHLSDKIKKTLIHKANVKKQYAKILKEEGYSEGSGANGAKLGERKSRAKEEEEGDSEDEDDDDEEDDNAPRRGSNRPAADAHAHGNNKRPRNDNAAASRPQPSTSTHTSTSSTPAPPAKKPKLSEADIDKLREGRKKERRVWAERGRKGQPKLGNRVEMLLGKIKRDMGQQ
ncbi:hypothetical protein MNV49_001881 [Pseudohyphozyma bogoriensis]|nr:hypothetical protein MNV49_001881 [Pseudohyphozyma bogoriensis]